MRIAKRVSCLAPSLTLALTARARELREQGRDVIGLGAGEPDFDTPDFIKEKAIADIRGGFTKYTAEKGAPEVLKAIATLLKRDYRLDYDAATEVILSCGGKHTLYNAILSLVDDGDEVIVPAPYWLSYPEMIKSAGGVPVIVSCPPAAGFKMAAAQLEAAITPRTVALIHNSPSNPTGAVYTREELLAIGEVLKRHPQVTLISDDIYMRLVYAGLEFHSLVALCPELRERALIVNGLSKAYSMTGWRLGWAAGPKPVIKAMATLQSHATSHPTSFCQRAAAVAMESDHAFLGPWVTEFDARRRMVIAALSAMPGVLIDPPPTGAFYAFPDVSAHYGRTIRGREITGSMSFCEAVLDTADVALVPGCVFGEDRCVRMSYATSRENLQKAMDRLAGFLEE